MSGIPIYTSSPINASKASGTTPQTAAPTAQTTPFAPNPAPATTTASSSTTSYPPAQPGAAAPAPTAAALRYAPVQPTPTTKTENDGGPPAPQPGAVPTPLSRTNIPPPPKAGETYHPPAPASMPQPYPPQMAIPPLTSAYGAQPPTSSTSTSTTASSTYPAPLPNADDGAPRRSLEHPPGYQQNLYASELSSDQRRAQDAANNSSSGLGGYGGSEKGGIDAESMWNTASKWVTAAGNKLSETEEEIWRRINRGE